MGAFATLRSYDLGEPEGGGRQLGTARRDFIALGIVAACIIMFVGLGGSVLAGIARSLHGVGLGPDKLAIDAVLLNIALIIFSWRRYRQLEDEVAVRRKAEEHARQLAEHDALTGCLNRRSIEPATASLLEDAAARGEIVAFLMIDLDSFKQVNDFHGHATGDHVLQETARRIAALLPAQSLCARLGGDEFACAVPFKAARADSIDRLASLIIDACAQPQVVKGLPVESSVSIGITRSDMKRMDDEPAAAETLLHMADIALYHAKGQGRNCYFWFEAPMESELRFRSELEAGIRAGVRNGEFVPFYEQQIDLATGRLTGFEMLARWNSPTLGPIGPEVFIPVAEEIGVIAELSECLIARALADAREWDAGLSLSVNISPVQLRDPWFAQRLLKLLVEANFPASRLEIEITESCLHENISVVRSLVTSLKNQGVRVSLDDFGTGYSSLAQLRTLPFDQIKIDRSFVTNMHQSTDSATIVKAIAALGKGLGLPITAEGVESEQVLEQLRGIGEIKGQGYFYGLPESAEDTRKRLAAMNLIAPGHENAPAPAPVADEPRRANG